MVVVAVASPIAGVRALEPREGGSRGGRRSPELGWVGSVHREHVIAEAQVRIVQHRRSGRGDNRGLTCGAQRQAVTRDRAVQGLDGTLGGGCR